MQYYTGPSSTQGYETGARQILVKLDDKTAVSFDMSLDDVSVLTIGEMRMRAMRSAERGGLPVARMSVRVFLIP